MPSSSQNQCAPSTLSHCLSIFRYGPTAMPMFRTLANRAASWGSRFSIMVSWARLSGSACASSNLLDCEHRTAFPGFHTHIAAAAAAAPLLCHHRRSNGNCWAETEGRRTAVEAHLWQLRNRQFASAAGRKTFSSALMEIRDNLNARISRRCASWRAGRELESSPKKFGDRDPRLNRARPNFSRGPGFKHPK